MFIRGINSLMSNAQPLIVIDGVEQDMQQNRVCLHDGQVNNILANISPDDVENVTVLKNATALYGARGANGVVIITTKRGQPVEVQLQARTARDSMASHLLHEIQHGIQSYEGFAGGGSKQNFISEADKTVLVRGISAACYLSAD